MVRVLRVLGAVVLPVLVVASCSDESSCCYQNIDDYCERNECVASFDDALADPCVFQDVFYDPDGERRAIGALGGFGGVMYFYRGDALVGTFSYTDVLEECACANQCGRRAECSSTIEVGEIFFDTSAGPGGNRGGLTHCTLCPESFGSEGPPPRCPFEPD